MKKVLIGLAVVVIIAAIAFLAFKARYNKMVTVIDGYTIEDIDPSRIADGTYQGSYGEFLVHVDLTVTIADGRITDITMVEQKAGPGYEALETIDRVKEAQSLDVDMVTGATGSSKTILIAIRKALENAPERELPVQDTTGVDSL